MKEERILQLLGEVDEKYIAEAAPKETQKKKPVLQRLMIIAACLGLLLTLGCAAVAVSPEVRAAVQSIIEILFPPKEVTLTPEGLPESVPHTAQGQDPTEDAPGFAIYVDEDGYEMTEENGVFVIRPKKSSLSREDVRQNNSALLEGLTVEEQEAFIDDRLAKQEAFYAALPPCEMEIRELEGTDLEAVATAIRTEMTQTWETVTELSCLWRNGLGCSAGKPLFLSERRTAGVPYYYSLLFRSRRRTWIPVPYHAGDIFGN